MHRSLIVTLRFSVFCFCILYISFHIKGPSLPFSVLLHRGRGTFQVYALLLLRQEKNAHEKFHEPVDDWIKIT